jgi:hypothetical protein
VRECCADRSERRKVLALPKELCRSQPCCVELIFNLALGHFADPGASSLYLVSVMELPAQDTVLAELCHVQLRYAVLECMVNSQPSLSRCFFALLSVWFEMK